MHLTHGRPRDLTERLPKEVRVYDLLDSLGIDYAHIDHPAADTMDDCAAVDALLGAAICKNLLLCNRQQTNFYLLMLPGEKHFKTSVLSKQIGSSRLSFADAEAMARFLDITPGSLSVLGLMNDRENRVELLIDTDLLDATAFGCHPCINTSSLRISMDALINRLLPAMHHSYTAVTLPWGE